jgi:uncharacterized protein YbjT (DUF2867 family)
MTKVLVLGANGHLARNTIPFLLRNPDVVLTLYLRRASRLARHSFQTRDSHTQSRRSA